MAHDIVAMRAARLRFEIRRGVDMAHPELCEIGRQLGGCCETEILRKLQAIGGARNGPAVTTGHAGRSAPLSKRRSTRRGLLPLPRLRPKCGGPAQTLQGRSAMRSNWP